MAKNKKKLKIEKMDGKSMNVWGERVKKIQQEFPEVLSENQVDCEQLKRLIGNENVAESERYQFSWAGKSAAFQEIQRRTTATLKPDRKESVNFDKTENIFIEGENLEVLKILQKTYYGRIKMIYIDPPYNTGNDFVYNDQFAESREEYEEKTGDVDKEGKKLRAFHKNTKENGHYHSNWLSMMYPRLYLARNLLREDGVIFVSIDDNEVYNLRMIMNEIFGEENFVNTFSWLNNLKGRQISGIGTAKTYEFVLCYAKSSTDISEFEASVSFLKKTMPDAYKGINYKIKEDKKGKYVIKNELFNTNSIFNEETRPNLVFNIHYNFKTGDIKFSDVDKDENFKGYIKIEPKKNNDGVHRFHAWRWNKAKILEDKENLEFVKSTDGLKVFTKVRNYNLTILKDFIPNIPTTVGNKELQKLFNDKRFFDYPKPVNLIKIFLTQMGKEDIILDFFAGSATTAHAVMDLNAEDGGNRKYIMVQLPEETKEGSEARKAGYKNIAQIGRERIRRAAKKIQKEAKHKFDAGFKAFTLSPSNFKIWRREKVENEAKLQRKLEDAVNNLKEGAKKENMLFELMLKLGINPNVKIEDKKDYYSISGGEYIICLSQNINKNIVESIINENPRVVVCLDKGFNGNDELKINTALQMKSKNIEFKVI